MADHERNGPFETGRRGIVERADYLIDRSRVMYEFGGGWSCDCPDFARSDACRHTREAAGRRAAQMQIRQHLADSSPGARTRDTHLA
jgi:hypothetical protein